jgi:plasmid stabilization system protein ParE
MKNSGRRWMNSLNGAMTKRETKAAKVANASRASRRLVAGRGDRLISAGALLVLLLLVAATPVAASDKEFDAVVRHIEATYKTKRVRIPFMGLARFVVKVAKPEGVKSFKLATFERLATPEPGAAARLGQVLRGSLEPAWRPLVRVRSGRDREQTHVYFREEGRDVKVMVVTVEPEEATVVRVKMGRDALARWMRDHGVGIVNAEP